MSNIITSGVLLLVVLVAVQETRARKEYATTSDLYSAQRKNNMVLDKKYPSKDDHRRTQNYHSRKASGINSKHNNGIAADKMEDTLSKIKHVREEHLINALDSKNKGVALYKEKYPSLKLQKHYVYRNEIDNSINTDAEKYYHTKDNPKQKQHYQGTKTTIPEYNEESLQRDLAKSEPADKKVSKSEDSPNNLSLVSNSTDFDLLESSNDSAINESSSSNTTEFEKSRFARCPMCRMRDGDKQYRIQKLKQTILSSLHMTSPPNASKEVLPKMPAMAHIYEMEENMMNDSPYSKRNDNSDDQNLIIKTERIFTKARLSPSTVLLNITDSIYFAPPIKLYTCKIRTAHVWFYIRKQNTHRPYVHLTIERILPESVPANRLIAKTIFSQKLMGNRSYGWKRIDLRNVLRRWLVKPMCNHGLVIRALDSKGNNLVVLTPSPEVDRGYEPWLDTKVVEQKSHSRHRRSQSLRCTTNSSESRCCRYPLIVNFGDFGWEWIIAPNQVKADYCSGECRMTMQDSTAHSWIQQQVPGTTGSCCAPKRLGALALLYFDESYNVLYQILQNMKVEECGCA